HVSWGRSNRRIAICFAHSGLRWFGASLPGAARTGEGPFALPRADMLGPFRARGRATRIARRLLSVLIRWPAGVRVLPKVFNGDGILDETDCAKITIRFVHLFPFR